MPYFSWEYATNTKNSEKTARRLFFKQKSIL